MKRLTLILGGLAVGAVFVLVPLSSRAVGIAGTKHDFTSYTNYWINGTGDWVSHSNTCGVCHTIHHANPDKMAPLWIHTTTAQTFTPYTSPTFGAGGANITVSPNLTSPGGTMSSSRACLSCHDGSVAVNASYTSGGGTTNNGGTAVYIGQNAIIPDGTPANDLSNMHPIGFSYQQAATYFTWGIKPVTSVAFNGLTIQQVMLFNGQVECASCHDIHCTKGTSVSGSGIYTVQSGTALCETCHLQ